MTKKAASGGKKKQAAGAVGAAASAAVVEVEEILVPDALTGGGVDVDEPGELAVVMEVLPENLIINERLEKLREWTGKTKQEMTIPQLAQSILDDGQTDPGTTWETEDGYVLLSGHRRRKAVMLLREQGHNILFRMIVHPEVKTEQQALRVALHANEQREDFNDMERAAHIPMIRELFEWEGEEGTAEVAGFLGKDPATVTQLERLLTLPELVQTEVREGRLTRSAALEFLTTPAEKVEEVHKKATEIAQGKAEKKELARLAKEEKKAAAKAAKEAGKLAKKQKSPPPTAAQLETVKAAKRDRERTAKKKAAEVAAKATPTGADVRKAQTVVDGGTTKLKAPKMSEAIEFFDDLNRKGMPESMVAFADGFAQYGHGKLVVKELAKAWKEIENEMFGREMKKAKDSVAKIPLAPAKKKKAASPSPKKTAAVAAKKSGGKSAKK